MTRTALTESVAPGVAAAAIANVSLNSPRGQGGFESPPLHQRWECANRIAGSRFGHGWAIEAQPFSFSHDRDSEQRRHSVIPSGP